MLATMCTIHVVIPTLPTWNVHKGTKRAHSRQLVLIRIADLLEDGRGRLRRRGLAVRHVEQAKLVLHDVRDGLRVGGRAGPAAPDRVGHARQLVCHSVGNVCARRRPGVGACKTPKVHVSGVFLTGTRTAPQTRASGEGVGGVAVPRMTPSLNVTAILSSLSDVSFVDGLMSNAGDITSRFRGCKDDQQQAWTRDSGAACRLT